MDLEIWMSFAAFFFELLLVIFEGHQGRYVLAAFALVFSMMTPYGVQQSYVARGRNIGGLSNRALYYFFTVDGMERWHTPSRMEIVRFIYSLLAIGTSTFDFFKVIMGWGFLQGFAAFPAAFACGVLVSSVVDQSFGP